MADQTHLSWLKEGVEAWNRRRDQEPFTPDLNDAELRGLDLTGVDLRGAGLHRAVLDRAILRDAALAGANLQRASLKTVVSTGADLRGATLASADLTGAVLDDADLSGVRAPNADLTRASLVGAVLRDADLRDARLVEADLTGAALEKATLSSGDLRNARLAGASLAQALLIETQLDGATLTGATLAGAKLWMVDLGAADLRESDLAGADMRLPAFLSARPNAQITDFSRVSIYQDQLDGMLWDATTKLPSALARPSHQAPSAGADGPPEDDWDDAAPSAPVDAQPSPGPQTSDGDRRSTAGDAYKKALKPIAPGADANPIKRALDDVAAAADDALQAVKDAAEDLVGGVRSRQSADAPPDDDDIFQPPPRNPPHPGGRAISEEEEEAEPSPRREAETERGDGPVADRAPDKVTLSAFAPRAVRPQRQLLIQAALHLPIQMDMVRRLIAEIDETAERRGFVALGEAVPAEAELRVEIDAPDLAIKDRAQSFAWRGDPCVASFVATAPALSFWSREKTAMITLRVSMNGAPIGRLVFPLTISRRGDEETVDAVASDYQPYSYVFISYASEDRPLIDAVSKALEQAGVEHFYDVETLRAGQDWAAALKTHVGRADLFMLYWSKDAVASKWVAQEAAWAQELRAKSPVYSPDIKPYAIGDPPPSPPKALADLHFERLQRFPALSGKR